jgi:Zn finger protein HypA/HybF involved in hydrogenase expression
MTFVPEKRKCNVCGHVYSWNPSIGKIGCPRCGSLDNTVVSINGFSIPKIKK